MSTEQDSSPSPTPSNSADTKMDSLEPSDTEDYEPKKKAAAAAPKKRLRKYVDDEAGEERKPKKKKKGKRIEISDDEEEDEYSDDPEEGTASDLDGFIASDSEPVVEDSPAKHRKIDRVYELKDNNEDEAHVQSVRQREEMRKLKEQVAKLEKEKAETAAKQKEKEEVDKITERMKKTMDAQKPPAESSSKKRKKEDSDSEVDDDGKEPITLVSKMMNKKAKPATEPPASATKVTPADVKKSTATPKKPDVPVEAVKKTTPTPPAASKADAGKPKKLKVGDSFSYKDNKYFLTHYEEPIAKARKTGESDEDWLKRHPINQLSTCLLADSKEDFADFRKSMRVVLEYFPNAEPTEEDLDEEDQQKLPLGMHTGEGQGFFFCVVPATGAPVVMLDGAKAWEAAWEAEKGDGKPKLDTREYDPKVTGAGKKGKGKTVHKPWHVFNLNTNIFEDKGSPYVKLILHPEVAKAKFKKVLKRREATQRRKNKKAREGEDSEEEAEGEEEEADADEEEEEQEEEKPKSKSKPAPKAKPEVAAAVADATVAYAVVNDSDRVVDENKKSIQEMSDRLREYISQYVAQSVAGVDQKLEALREDFGSFRELMNQQNILLTKMYCANPTSISLAPLPAEKKAAAAAAEKKKKTTTDAQDIDAAVAALAAATPAEDIKALEEAMANDDNAEFMTA